MEGTEADIAEMDRLLSGCASRRLKDELHPWLDDHKRLLASEMRADQAEMTSLLALSSSRVAGELQPWLDERELDIHRLESSAQSAPAARAIAEQRWGALASAGQAIEAEKDHQEMAELLAGCRSSRVRRELQPWLDRKAAESRPSSAPASLPSVVIVGARGVGKRRLLKALAGGCEGKQMPSGEVAADALIKTKYYQVTVRFCLVDTAEDALEALGGSEKELIRSAGAVILLWSEARPESFEQAKRCFLAATNGDGPEHTVRICVAAADGDKAADHSDAFPWCLDNGFEYLSCSLADSELEALRDRRLGLASQRGGLLHAGHSEDSLLRIADALECRAWPGSEQVSGREAASSVGEKMPSAPPAHEASSSSTAPPPSRVVVAGAPGLGQRDLALAMAGDVDASNEHIEALLETKYYKRRLRMEVMEVKGDSNTDATMLSMLRSAEGVILLWDMSRPETFTAVRQLFETACPRAEDEDGGGFTDCTDAVQICVAVEGCSADGTSSAAAGGEGTAAEDLARGWCAEHYFEYLQCTLGAGDLQAVRKRWQSGSHKGSLLSMEDEIDSAERIVEALSCHTWKELEWTEDVGSGRGEAAAGYPAATAPPASKALKGPHGSTSIIAAAPEKVLVQEVTKPSTDVALKKKPAGSEFPSEESVDMMENFADEIRKVREMGDAPNRRDRAAELALKVAASFGLDEGTDDED